jgi:uncharacterized membrane protein
VKNKRPTTWLERLLQRLMLAGVASSAACMIVGLMMYLGVADVSTATSVVTLGLLVLMATPGLRVGLAVLEAVRTRDWFFVLITSIVVMLLGLTAGLAWRHL